MTLYLSSHPEIKRTGYNLGKRFNQERSGHFGWAPEIQAPERAATSTALQDSKPQKRGTAERKSQIERALNMASFRRNMAEFSSLGCFSVELWYLEFLYRFSPISNSHLGNQSTWITLAQFIHVFGPSWVWIACFHEGQSVRHSLTHVYSHLLCYEEVTMVCSCCLFISFCFHLFQLLLDEYLRPLHLWGLQ